MHLNLGPELFRFRNFFDWTNNAQARYAWLGQVAGVPAIRTICVDATGRVCVSGKEFMSARDRDAFPCLTYHVDPDFTLPPATVAP